MVLAQFFMLFNW